jgi:hypothetical protein
MGSEDVLDEIKFLPGLSADSGLLYDQTIVSCSVGVAFPGAAQDHFAISAVTHSDSSSLRGYITPVLCRSFTSNHPECKPSPLSGVTSSSQALVVNASERSYREGAVSRCLLLPTTTMLSAVSLGFGSEMGARPFDIMTIPSLWREVLKREVERLKAREDVLAVGIAGSFAYEDT